MSPLDYLKQAQYCAQKMQFAVESDDWEAVPQIDQELRAAFDQALEHFAEASDEDRRLFRELGAKLLSDHQDVLRIAEARLGVLRTEVASALKSGKAAKTYSDNR